MCGDLRLHPQGDTIYTKCGHVLLASEVQSSDMTWVASMGLTWRDLAFHPSNGTVYVIDDSTPALYSCDGDTLMPTTTFPLSAPARRILAGLTYLVVIRDELGGNLKTRIEVIPYADL